MIESEQIQQMPVEKTVELPEANTSYLPPSPSEDFFKYRIEGSDVIDELQHQLRGEVYDPSTNKYEQKFERMINEKGINKIVHIIYSLGNKIIFLGNLSQEQILYKCKMLKKRLANLFFGNYQEYEVKADMRALIIMSVVNTVHSSLSRSEHGRESQQLSTASQRHDVYSHQENNKDSGGIFSKFVK